jgi:hypothetical protein
MASHCDTSHPGDSLLSHSISGRARAVEEPVWRNRATDEQKRMGWEKAVRIEKIIVTVLHEAHKRQVEETMETLGEGPDGFYASPSE